MFKKVFDIWVWGKNKRWFLPLLPPLAKPILMSVDGSIGSKLLQDLKEKNFFVVERVDVGEEIER